MSSQFVYFLCPKQKQNEKNCKIVKYTLNARKSLINVFLVKKLKSMGQHINVLMKNIKGYKSQTRI